MRMTRFTIRAMRLFVIGFTSAPLILWIFVMDVRMMEERGAADPLQGLTSRMIVFTTLGSVGAVIRWFWEASISDAQKVNC